MHLYNMMSCEGLGSSIGGSCSMAWAALVILFLIIALARKWIFEQMEIGFNFIVAEAAGVISFMIAMAFIGSPRWCLLIGLAAGFVVGYFAQNLGGSE